MAIATSTAIIGAAVLGTAGTMYAGNKAAKASEKATETGTALQREQYYQSRSDQMPFMQAGYGAANALTGRLGLATQGVAPAGGASQAGGNALTGGAGSPDYAAYRAADPGIEAEFNRVRSQADPNSPQWQALGLDSLDNWTAAHYDRQGQSEGRTMPSIAMQQAAGPAAAGPAPYAQSGQDPGTFGNSSNPTWTAPAAYQASEYSAPADFSFSVDSFKDNPAYKFAMEQGSGQILANAGATGALQSGAALKRLQDRGQQTAYQFYDDERDFAFNKFVDGRNFGRGVFENDRNFGRASYDTDRAFGRQTYETDRNYLTNRYDTQTGNLFNLMGMGQNAAAQTGNAGQNYANNVTGLVQGNAANQGNAAIAGANSMNSLLSAGVNAYAYGNGLGGARGPAPTPGYGYGAGRTGYTGGNMGGLY